jgi:Ca2+-binding EF-hand superfamily protein
MKNMLNYLAIVFCFTFGSTLAFACPTKDGGKMHAQKGEKMCVSMDTNADGAITRDEFDAFHDKHFKKMDANGDGKISRDEADVGHKKMTGKDMDKRFDEADANHDGSLTREEAKNMPMLSSRFDEVDANHDGKVSREERDAAMKKMHQSGGERKPSN